MESSATFVLSSPQGRLVGTSSALQLAAPAIGGRSGPPAALRQFGRGSGAENGKGWSVAAGVLSSIAAHTVVRRKAFGGRGGYGGGGYGGGGMDIQQRTEAKRNREVSEFKSYQARLLRSGMPPRTDRYWDVEERRLFKTAHVSAGINFSKYNDIEVECTGGQGTESAIASFQEACDRFDLPAELTANIERCGYDKPTPVQKYSIPAVMVGSDVMVAAQTGSGKTAAFLVPIVTAALRVGAKPLTEGPVAPTSIVLAPTRELCQQITQEAKRLCFRSEARVASIYGGADAGPQLRNLAEGCDIAICTPGRLEDFLERGVISVEQVRFLALDEADRMLDMGFEPQIRSIIDRHGMPQPATGADGRQTMMFSATFPQEMQDMALDFLDPSYLWIGVGRVGCTVSDVDQRFEDVGYSDKFDMLLSSMEGVKSKDGGTAKTIIFANQKSTVDNIAWRLRDSRISAAPIHGGLSQMQRERAIQDLKSGRVSVLVATDVAARGLDLPGIDHVVNFELPQSADDYVHRIGRTGRIGNSGVATSLVGRSEPALRDIVRSLQEAGGEGVEVPGWLEEMVGQGGGRRR
eukprot:CAMPEP_0117576296 /NCGR_PEP_ID=MMETSP0784-20121206/62716_1 /TAXON_ID=39447 /ORGANISM="" /LENGTH=577 /DNA_ID=CAMNT_0005375527 /DNA_START=63 /DNA_END=1796 /DNA_ORIENTATION=+